MKLLIVGERERERIKEKKLIEERTVGAEHL